MKSPYQSWVVYHWDLSITVWGTRADAESWARHFTRTDGRTWKVKKNEDSQA